MNVLAFLSVTAEQQIAIMKKAQATFDSLCDNEKDKLTRLIKSQGGSCFKVISNSEEVYRVWLRENLDLLRDLGYTVNFSCSSHYRNEQITIKPDMNKMQTILFGLDSEKLIKAGVV